MFKGFMPVPNSLPLALHRCDNCDVKLTSGEYDTNKFSDGTALCDKCWEAALRQMVF